jgi:hypothetical protein
MPQYTVRQGDSITSIAFEQGFYWETIWQHPNNAGIRELRENPYVLHPGDELFIPDRQTRQVSGSSEQRHRFRRRGVPERFSVRLLDENEAPRTSEPYTLLIDGVVHQGNTDSDGMIQASVLPNARQGRLIVGEQGRETFHIRLGHLDPPDGISGIQARLRNLGLYHGDIDGQLNPETIAAIEAFQEEKDLEITGEMDDDTRGCLNDLHVS